MERNIQKSGLMNLFSLLLVGVATFAVARYSGSVSSQVTAGFIGLGFLIAAISWFQMRLEDRERLEKLEFDEVTRAGSSSALFATGESDAFPVRRSREQFERYFVPAFTVVLLLLQAAGCWLLWRWMDHLTGAPVLRQPMLAMSILGLLALVLFLLGQFSSGLARLESQRLLSPGASQMLLGAYLIALNIAAIAGIQFGFSRVDVMLARALIVLLGVLAVENLLTLLLEVYRPRVRGRKARLLYESRLVGLFSHPEGIFTTAAHALDYQFGFKVSDTWFFQFLQRALIWLVAAQLGILLASTSLVYIQPGEQGLLERFGKPRPSREILDTGFHFKWPWPVERVHRFHTQAIQSFDVGFEHEDEEHEEGHGEGHDEEQGAVLWTVSHYKEEFHLLVASREAADSVTVTNAAGKKAPPVNLLSVGIPVQYQVSDLKAWAYNYSDATNLLKQVSTREVVRYLVGVDVNEIMSTARFTAGEELKKRIQARANELKMGVQILFVGLQDVHPPVQVGAAYERVVGAKQKREADILRAQAYAIETNAATSSDALRRRLTAAGARTRTEAAAKASESLFTNQMAAYTASPEVYTQRAYLQTLAERGAGARKFILATTNKEEVLMLNMEDKLRDDALLNIALPPIPAQGTQK